MKFSYKGRLASGALTVGVIVAENKADAITALQDAGTKPISLKEKKNFAFGGSGGGIQLIKRVKLSEKIMFTKNLAGMLRAGLALSRALEVLDKQTTNLFFKKIIAELLATIDKGGTLSDGLAKYPKVFSPLFIAMVRSGEESGGLPSALGEVGMNLEKSYALQRKVKSALMYPSIIIGAIILIAILMFIFVVPTLTKTFKELGAELPGSTKIVIGISDLFSNHLGLLLLGMAGFIGLVILLFRIPRTKRMIDYVIVRAPVLGTLVKEINAARTVRTLSSLLSSGVSIGRALVITQDVLQNSYYKKIIVDAGLVVEKGEPMSSTFLSHTDYYPVMVGEMMQVGEETGKLSQMLLDIAIFYEGEVDAKTKDLSTIIEPVLMIFIGAGVGFFAVSMLSPMYSIMDSIQ